MNASSTPTPDNHLEAHGSRPWFPTIVAVLAALGIAIIRLQPELERNTKGWMTSLVVLLAALLGLIWFLFFSPVRRRVRFGTAGALAIAIFGLTQTLRLDGTVDGTGLPKLAWRWTAIRTPHLISAPAADAANVVLAPIAVAAAAITRGV